MIPATTAVEVASSRPARAEDVERLERVHDEAVVGEDRLPGERPDQVGDEEGRDDDQQQQVLPAAAAERDPVRDRVADHEREQRRDPRVLERADELGAVVRDRVPVVAPRPREGVSRRRSCPTAATGRRGSPSGTRKKTAEEEQPGREQQVRRQPAMPVEEAHRPLLSRDQVLPLRRGTSGCSAPVCRRCGRCRASSCVGKMSGLFATAGLNFSAALLRAGLPAGCSRCR